jgi:hypothetical protein
MLKIYIKSLKVMSPVERSELQDTLNFLLDKGDAVKLIVMVPGGEGCTFCGKKLGSSLPTEGTKVGEGPVGPLVVRLCDECAKKRGNIFGWVRKQKESNFGREHLVSKND